VTQIICILTGARQGSEVATAEEEEERKVLEEEKEKEKKRAKLQRDFCEGRCNKRALELPKEPYETTILSM